MRAHVSIESTECRHRRLIAFLKGQTRTLGGVLTALWVHSSGLCFSSHFLSGGSLELANSYCLISVLKQNTLWHSKCNASSLLAKQVNDLCGCQSDLLCNRSFSRKGSPKYGKSTLKYFPTQIHLLPYSYLWGLCFSCVICVYIHVHVCTCSHVCLCVHMEATARPKYLLLWLSALLSWDKLTEPEFLHFS